MNHTIEEAKKYVEENRKDMMESLQNNKEAPEWLKTSKHFHEVWCSGCWMNNMLREAGATEDEIHNIGFCHGQRSVFGNSYKWAVSYLNEFETNKRIKDKHGLELADEINNTHMQVLGDGCIAMTIEK